MPQSTYSRPTWAEISLPALTDNYRTIRKHLNRDAQFMAVVKANAYGHGAVRCAQALEAAGADWFGVALVEEGIELRNAGIARPIFCVGGFWCGQAEDIIKHDLTPALFRLDAAEELNSRANEAGRIVSYHLKVDTGMGRLGVPFSEVAAFAQELKRFDNIKLDGLMTHLADADSCESDCTEKQIAYYNEALGSLREIGIDPTWRHLAASAGVHAYTQAHGNLARVGAALYGLTRDVLSPNCEPFAVRPVMSLHSRIVMLKTVPAGTPLGYGGSFVTERESRIATISIGYADGFHRAHSSNGRVIVRGQYAPVVGRVSMDLTILDVTEVADVALGDEVILIGERDGLRISAEDVAAQIGTISYEVVTGVSARVPRIFKQY